MRILRYLFAAALLCGLAGVAKAEPIADFQMVVVDPPPVPPPYAVAITSTTFSFAFTFPCATGQDPVGFTATGCWTGVNNTGAPITSLHMSFANTTALGSQPASCPSSGTNLDIFLIETCTLNPAGTAYLLDFSDGLISPDNGVFTILEAGPTAQAFGQVSAVANTPEPGSIWLLSTGVLTGGFFLADWRRRAAFATRA